MKTYNQAIEMLARSLYHGYMRGDMMPRAEGLGTVALIYEVGVESLSRKVDRRTKQLMKITKNGRLPLP